MFVPVVVYAKGFYENLRELPREIALLTAKKEAIFKLNPLHPSLRLHGLRGRLKGYWSISINGSYRIIFSRMTDGTVYFIAVGKHDIYDSL